MGDFLFLHPVSDIMAWTRLVFGVALTLVLPGYWILGRFLAARWPLRLGVSFMAGILAACGAGILTGHLDLPFTLVTVLPGLGILGLGLGFWPAYRRTVGLLTADGPLLTRRQWLLLGLICLLLFATQIMIQGQFPAPPAVHDSGNHAFLTSRIMETGHTGSAFIFGPPYARPQRPYFVGWHAAVALAATASGLPPYVATWLFSLLTLVFLPLSLAIVWRRFGLSAEVTLLGAALVLVSGNILVEIPWRGGMGQFVGMFSLALPYLALVQALRRGSLGLAALGGLLLGILVWVHGSWVLVTIILCGATVIQLDGTGPPTGRRTWAALGVALGVFLAVILPDVLPTAAVYKATAYRPQDPLPLWDGVRAFTRSAGSWPPLEILTLLALILGLARREIRILAMISVFFGLLSICLAVFQDPVSMFLSQPWYQIYFRLHRPQVFLLPVLIAGFILELRRRWVARRPGRWRDAVLGLAVLGAVVPAWFHLDGEKLAQKVLFDDDDVRLAHRLATVVPADALVANWRNDGSCWAMQISGRHFLQGSNWILGEDEGKDYRFHVKELLTGRLTGRTLQLRRMNTQYVYATSHWMFKAAPIITRSRLDRSPHFKAVLRGKYSTLYRIDWSTFK